MASSTREQVVVAADRLFYEHGYEHTSFASIASAVGISRGNFYHHFKTKDEILQAVIERRIGGTREMLTAWADAAPSPLQRIFSFVEIVVANRDDIERFGCPVGTLTSELAKLDHPCRPHAVGIFELFRTWLREQFEQLGRADADDLALHVLTFSQGVATLSNALGDRAYVEREVQRLEAWLRDLTGH